MPLPSVLHYGANQCQAQSKRTGHPCKNPAAFGCRTCRMHGAHRSRRAATGAKHWNYRHGRETLAAKQARNETFAELKRLHRIGLALTLFDS